MRNTSKVKMNKLFSLLGIIDENEIYRLKRYIDSDYFNTNTRLKILFEAILEARIENSSFNNIDPEQLYKKVFPDRTNSGFADDFSGLLKLVRGYLSQEAFNLDENAKTRFFIDTLIGKEADDHVLRIVNQEAKKYEKPEKSKQKQSVQNYYHNLFISQIKLNHIITCYRSLMKPQLFTDMDNNVDKFYALLKAKNQILLKQNAKDNGIDFQIAHQDALFKIVASIDEVSHPLIHQYINAFKLSESNDINQLHKITTTFEEYGKPIHIIEELLLCQLMFNICIRIKGTSNSKELLNYRYFFLNRLIKNEAAFFVPTTKRTVRSTTYVNYMRVLANLRRFDEFEKEKRKYNRKVRYTHPHEEKCFNTFLLILLNLEKHLDVMTVDKNKSDYYLKQALYVLEKHESAFARGALTYSIISFRIMFEVSGVKIAYYLNDQFSKRRSAMNKYLMGAKKVDIVIKKSFINFSNLILKLYKLKNSKQLLPNQIADLRNQINIAQSAEKEWLNDQLDAIESSIIQK